MKSADHLDIDLNFNTTGAHWQVTAQQSHLHGYHLGQSGLDKIDSCAIMQVYPLPPGEGVGQETILE